MKTSTFAVLALLYATVNSACPMVSNESDVGSYYDTGVAPQQDDGAVDVIDLYVYYYYYCEYYIYSGYYCHQESVYVDDYYYDGQTIAFIICVEVLLPLLCCVGVVVTILCCLKCARQKRMREAEIQRQQLMDAQ